VIPNIDRRDAIHRSLDLLSIRFYNFN
jgi:hypothetical protein